MTVSSSSGTRSQPGWSAASRFFLGSTFAFEPFQVDVGVIDILHGVGNESVTGHFSYGLMHLTSNVSIRRVPGRLAAKLDEVECLTRVHLHDKSHVVRERDDVLGNVGAQIISDVFIELAGSVHDCGPLRVQSLTLDVSRELITETSRVSLPFQGP